MGTFEYPVFSFRSTGGIYNYLVKIRQLEGCRSAWLFGDEIHVTLSSAQDAERISREIGRWGDAGIQWKPIEAGIEDRFMERMQ